MDDQLIFEFDNTFDGNKYTVLQQNQELSKVVEKKYNQVVKFIKLTNVPQVSVRIIFESTMYKLIVRKV